MAWQWAITTTLPVLTFMVGLWWNRRDADRREDRAFHRDTILELQDTLELLWGTATGATTEHGYRGAWLRTLTLSTRITNFKAKELVDRVMEATDAIVKVAPDSDERKTAVSAAAKAIGAANAHLSHLLRHPPWSYMTRAEWHAEREPGAEFEVDED
jgi:hypothetical protein